jgi:hypothetical protein
MISICMPSPSPRARPIIVGKLVGPWLRSFAVAGFLTACAEPKGPEVGPEPTTRIESAFTTATITSLGTTLRPEARVVGVTPAPPITWTVDEEIRWAPSLPVIDQDALRAGTIVARAPGHIVAVASAPNLEPVRIRIRVTPTEPLLLAPALETELVSGSVASLPAYRATEWNGEIRVDDRVVPRLEGDSATVRFRIPADFQTTSCQARPYPVSADGIAVSSPIILAIRPEAVDAPALLGAASRVPLTSRLCVRVPPSATAQHAIALFDPRGVIDTGSTKPLGYEAVMPAFELVYGGPLAGVSAPTSVDVSPAAAAHTGSAPPYEVGTQLLARFGVGLGSPPFLATVRRVYGDRISLLMPTDQASAIDELVLPVLDAVVPSVLTHLVPLLQPLQAPNPSAWHYPLLVRAIGPQPSPTRIATLGPAMPDGQLEFQLEFGSRLQETALGPSYLFGEVSRQLILQRVRESFAVPSGLPLAFDAVGIQSWGLSALTRLLLTDAVLGELGVPEGSNYDWWNATLSGSIANRVAPELFDAGQLTNPAAAGAAWLARAAIAELTREAGLSREAARQALLPMLPFGFHGCNPTCRVGGGVAERMAALLGRAWDPTDFVLRAILAYASDDRLAGQEWQVPDLRRAGSQVGLIPAPTWPGSAVISLPASGPQRRVMRFGTATMIFLLPNPSQATIFELSASVPLELAMLRIQ